MAMPQLRYHCSLEGLEENWVEVNPVWTRKEMRDWTATKEIEEIVAFWHMKMTACHIDTLDGSGAITDPALITVETVDSALDVRLVDFLGGVLSWACVHLKSLGLASGRLSSDTSEKKTTKTAE